MRHRRSRVRRRLDSARACVGAHRQEVAIVGSGPAGLAAAQQLARAGHAVTVFEKSDRIGGLLRYGIPDFKMEKRRDRPPHRTDACEGVEFAVNTHIGAIVPMRLRRDFDAVLLATGAEHPRDLPVPGRELKGIHFAMDFLTAAESAWWPATRNRGQILATGKRVIIMGGGDTGADCLGTSHRQKAAIACSSSKFWRCRPAERDASTPWPMWPLQLRSESSHEEGGERDWSVRTTRFSGIDTVEELHFVRVDDPTGKEHSFGRGSGSAGDGIHRTGATGCDRAFRPGAGCPRQRAAEDFQTSAEGVFAAGDARRGQSLVVWAIAEGRRAASAMDRYLAVNGRE